jgi:hypothetical protein
MSGGIDCSSTFSGASTLLPLNLSLSLNLPHCLYLPTSSLQLPPLDLSLNLNLHLLLLWHSGDVIRTGQYVLTGLPYAHIAFLFRL